MDAAQWHSQLATGQWFSHLPAPFQTSLLAHARLRQLTAGQYLFKRGDPPCGLYAVLEGSLRISAVNEQGKEVVYYVVGRRAVSYFQFRRRATEAEWIGDTDTPAFQTAEEISSTLLEAFLRPQEQGGVDEIHLVYNRFISMMTQLPETVRLLPLEVVEADESEASGPIPVYPLYEFEPDADSVLDALLPVYIQSRVFNALLQSSAAKHAATQKAMKSASDNADKLITDYTRLRNNARQAEITQQIAEIVGGADALAS